jgi:hypothetical protein
LPGRGRRRQRAGTAPPKSGLRLAVAWWYSYYKQAGKGKREEFPVPFRGTATVPLVHSTLVAARTPTTYGMIGPPETRLGLGLDLAVPERGDKTAGGDEGGRGPLWVDWYHDLLI